MMAWAFDHMQRPDGSSVYLRLSTRAIPQIAREDDSWKNDILKGGYWLKQPGENAEAAIVFTGVVAPEAVEAWEELAEDIPGLGLLNVPSRSEERRVGKERFSTCSTRGWPDH